MDIDEFLHPRPVQLGGSSDGGHALGVYLAVMHQESFSYISCVSLVH